MSARKHFICTVPGCGRRHCAAGLCNTHYARSRRRTGLEPERPIADRTGPRTGPTNAKWKERIVRPDGYVFVHAPEGHPMANSQGYILEHRLLKSQQLGRVLTPTEIVHHRDHDRAHNEPRNTKLIRGHRAHAKLHSAHYEFRGQSHTIPEWAALFHLSRRTINGRMQKGWSLERALTTRPGPSRTRSWRQ